MGGYYIANIIPANLPKSLSSVTQLRVEQPFDAGMYGPAPIVDRSSGGSGGRVDNESARMESSPRLYTVIGNSSSDNSDDNMYVAPNIIQGDRTPSPAIARITQTLSTSRGHLSDFIDWNRNFFEHRIAGNSFEIANLVQQFSSTAGNSIKSH